MEEILGLESSPPKLSGAGDEIGKSKVTRRVQR